MNVKKIWDESYVNAIKLHGMSHGVVSRESYIGNGIPIGMPVKIVEIKGPMKSMKNQDLPYISVSVILPNNEQRKINGYVISEDVDAEINFNQMKKIFKK